MILIRGSVCLDLERMSAETLGDTSMWKLSGYQSKTPKPQTKIAIQWPQYLLA